MTLARAAAVICVLVSSAGLIAAQSDDGQFSGSLDHRAIRYSTAATTDAVAQLSRRMASGGATLTFDPEYGYLRAVLAALNVSIESQLLVFSKTSLQGSFISPATPRAIFFNDSVAVGWIPRAPLLEIAALDPEQGMIFYGLARQFGAPTLRRMDATCLSCHVSPSTLGVPGIAVGSTVPRANGTLSVTNAFTTDHRTPLPKRWGGWYVTGTHGTARHNGNAFAAPDASEVTVGPASLNVETLGERLDLSRYPAPHSDIAAMLVLDHQAHMTNLLTRLGWEARIALDQSPEAAERLLAGIVREVVDYLLFVDEAPLEAPIRGRSGFAESFAARGKRDSRGRSLKDLDLTSRLLRYPCSYMIDSDSFNRLPAVAKQAVYRRMWTILSGEDRSARYRRLSPEDRRAIIEILGGTKRDLPPFFTPAA
jgi:hypothetical protein